MKSRRHSPRKAKAPSVSPQDEAAFRKYIATRQILVADTSLQFRTGITKLLRDLGAKAENVLLAANYHTALNEIQAIRPELVVCDFHLGDQNGLKLIHHQKRQFLEPDDSLFILVTSDTTEAAVAQAAEEEVDSYILKPFTIASFREHLIQATLAKINPDPYRKAILAAKADLRANDPASALKTLHHALRLNDKPSLAHYYMGRAHLLEEQLEKAEAAFKKGLLHNPLHYRCLTGLFDLLIRTRKTEQAYVVGRKLVETFPPTPQRLEALITLAIQNQFFSDTEPYLRMYQDMDYRTPELSRCMSAALVVTGKHHLEHGEMKKAVASFDQAITTSARAPGILDKVISALIEHGDFQLADAFLKNYPSSLRQTPEYLTMEFILFNETALIDKILTHGKKVLKQGIRDPRIYEILIRRSMQAKLKRAAEVLAYEAASLWPDQRERLLKLADAL